MAGKVVQCKKCARLYQSLGASPYCPKCVEDLEQSFVLVKDYIYDHPQANAVEISEETGVPEKDIFYFLKEGRLSVSEDNGILRCEQCGRSITTGRYCDACKSSLERELSASVNDAMQKVNQSKGTKGKDQTGLGKMHINLRNR